MTNLIDQRTYGPIVIKRMEEKPVPDAVGPALKTFKQTQEELERCALEAELALMARDGAMAAIGAADAKLDGAATGLAKKVAGADLGSLNNPFADYSEHSVSSLCRLPYKTEVREVRDLATKIAAKGPPQEVTVKIAECLQHATAVETALLDLAVPQREYDEKRAARDQAAMAWSKAFAKLRLRAELAYEDQPEVLEAIFAKPGAVQRPVKRRKKKQAAQTPEKPE